MTARAEATVIDVLLFGVGALAGVAAVLAVPELPWAMPPWPRMTLGILAAAVWIVTWVGSGLLRD